MLAKIHATVDTDMDERGCLYTTSGSEGAQILEDARQMILVKTTACKSVLRWHHECSAA